MHHAGAYMQQLTRARQPKLRWVSSLVVHGRLGNGLSRDTKSDPVSTRAEQQASQRQGICQWQETRDQEKGCRHGKEETKDHGALRATAVRASCLLTLHCPWAANPWIKTFGRFEGWGTENGHILCGEANFSEKHKWIPGWRRAQHHEGLMWVPVLTAHLSRREKGFFFL